jgi:3'-phosphoadenosine 5'-phosphosulfate sulfotransferase (PAPS reductase)/FAD synthetase
MFPESPHGIIRSAWEEYGARIVRRTAMLSGGDDSSTLAHWLAWHGFIDELVFLDTGTGLEGTRKFVRQFADHLGLPLEVWYAPPGAYETMIVTITAGFPGPAAHSYAYQRLKERPLEDYVRYRKRGWDRRSKVLLFSGIRKAESQKRMKIAEHPVESVGGRLWVAPFLYWTRADLLSWREQHDIPQNDVASLLHYSGECLCGAHASKGELDFLTSWYGDDPAVRDILRLQRLADRLGIERSRWGERWYEKASHTGRACGDCQMRMAGLDDCPVPVLHRRREVTVHSYGTRRPVAITARIHTPGRDPGPVAHEVHGVPLIELAADGIHLGETRVAQFEPGDETKLTLCKPSGFNDPASRMLADHHGERYTALDVSCLCDCKRKRGRLPKSCNHKPGLAVWMLSEPFEIVSTGLPDKLKGILRRVAEAEDRKFTPGPIRVTNGNGRRVFDRLRVVNRELLLQDEVTGGLVLRSDSDRAQRQVGAWNVPGMGLFRTVMIGRDRDAEAIERHWRRRGIEPGYRLPSVDSDYYEAVTVAPRYPGEPGERRLLNALPAELWTPEDPTPDRTGAPQIRPPMRSTPTIGDGTHQEAA